MAYNKKNFSNSINKELIKSICNPNKVTILIRNNSKNLPTKCNQLYEIKVPSVFPTSDLHNAEIKT